MPLTDKGRSKFDVGDPVRKDIWIRRLALIDAGTDDKLSSTLCRAEFMVIWFLDTQYRRARIDAIYLSVSKYHFKHQGV